MGGPFQGRYERPNPSEPQIHDAKLERETDLRRQTGAKSAFTTPNPNEKWIHDTKPEREADSRRKTRAIWPRLSEYPCFPRVIWPRLSEYPRFPRVIWPRLSGYPRFPREIWPSLSGYPRFPREIWSRLPGYPHFPREIWPSEGCPGSSPSPWEIQKVSPEFSFTNLHYNSYVKVVFFPEWACPRRVLF